MMLGKANQLPPLNMCAIKDQIIREQEEANNHFDDSKYIKSFICKSCAKKLPENKVAPKTIETGNCASCRNPRNEYLPTRQEAMMYDSYVLSVDARTRYKTF